MCFSSAPAPAPVQVAPPAKTEAEVRAEVAAEESVKKEETAQKVSRRRGRQATFGPIGPAATLVNFEEKSVARSSRL